MDGEIISTDRGAIRLWKQREDLISGSEGREEGALSMTESNWLSWSSEWSFVALTLSWDESSAEEATGAKHVVREGWKGKDEPADDQLEAV